MKGREVLYLRADGDARMGLGHLLRCLALGQAWRDGGGEVRFITACREGAILRRLREEGFLVYPLSETYPHEEDWEATGACLEENRGAWLVLDGYHFDGAYHSLAKATGVRLMIIDDTAHLAHYGADIVLNQNVHGPDLWYPAGPETRLLRGTSYVLLRREFLSWRGWTRPFSPAAQRILVTLGGGDEGNLTCKVIRGLNKSSLDSLEVKVVIGPSNPHRQEIEEELSSVSFPHRLLRSANDMPSLMAWADVAISTAGSTLWELAFMGLPALLLVVAKNQRGPARRLQQEGIFQILWAEDGAQADGIGGDLSALMGKKEVRRDMSGKARLLVDGLGAERVAAILRETAP